MKWTCYCCDTFDGTRWEEKFDTCAEAVNYADAQAGEMLVIYVDDPEGRKVHRAGRF